MKYGITLVLAILVLGGGYHLYNAQNKEGSQTPNKVDESPKNESVLNTSIVNLLSENRKVKCSFDYKNADTTITGDVYIDGKRMRSDYITDDPEFGKIESSVIRDNRFLHVWGMPGVETGTKLSLGEAAEDAIDNFISTDEILDFDCSFWFVNERLFIPPAEIEFIDISSGVEQGIEEPLKIKADCSVCNEIIEPELREECRQDLNCIEFNE